MRKPASYILISIFLALFVAGAVFLFGGVSGEEFCPQRFMLRSFTYYRIPFAGTQVWPVSFGKSYRGTNALTTHLRANSLLGPTSNSPIRWDIVNLNQAGSSQDRGDAEILVRYLQQPGARGAEDWLKWTTNTKNQDLAATFWPIVAKLADAKLYILVPDVFDAARASESAPEFVAWVRDDLNKSIADLAAAELDRNNTKRVDELRAISAELASVQVASVEVASVEESKQDDDSIIEAEADPEEADIN